MKPLIQTYKEVIFEKFIRENENDSKKSLIQKIIDMLWGGDAYSINFAIELAKYQHDNGNFSGDAMDVAIQKNFGWMGKMPIDAYSIFNPALPKALDILLNKTKTFVINGIVPIYASKLKNAENINVVNLEDSNSLKNLYGLDNIKILTINSNNENFNTIPDGISGMKSLQNFTVSNNRFLHQLPSDLGLLPSLQILSISFTNISELPNSIYECKSLNYFNISKTPLTKSGDILNIIDRLKEINPNIQISR